jgi:hypothetical protein
MAPRTFAEDIEECAEGECIEFAVIDDISCGFSGPESGVPEELHRVPKQKVIPWEQARPALDYVYVGWNWEVPGVYAWTATKVIFVTRGDDTAEVLAAPRNPPDYAP